MAVRRAITLLFVLLLSAAGARSLSEKRAQMGGAESVSIRPASLAHGIRDGTPDRGKA